MMNLGDVPAGSVLYVPFMTYNAAGASVTITGLAVTDIEIYKDGSVTQRASDAGFALLDTDGIDFDGITGLHGFSVDLGDNTTAGFYAAGSTYWLIVSAITVDSQTVSFGYYFTIDKRNVLRPTVAGRTLDVSAGGEAGVDWANVDSPTTSLALTGTTIATTQKVDLETIKTQSVTAAAGVTFPTSVASPTNITAGTITTVTNLTNAPTAGDLTATMKTSVGTAVAASAVASVTGNVGGNVTGSVGSVVGAVGSVTAMVTANMTQISGDSTAADNLETAFDDTAGPVPWNGIPRQGTAQSATGTTVVLDSGAPFADDTLNGATLWVHGSTQGYWQSRSITDYVGSTDTATVETWTVTPSGTITYKIFGTPPAAAGGGLDAAGVRAAVGLASANLDTQLAAIESQTDDIGTAGAGLTAIPWNASWDAEVQSEAADALNAYDPPTNTEMEARTLVAANYATAANLATVDTVVDNLNLGIIYGAAATGTLSTTQATSNLTGYANDQLIGRVITFLTGNAEGESTDITDYASASGLLTFTALTTAPGNGDTFKIT